MGAAILRLSLRGRARATGMSMPSSSGMPTTSRPEPSASGSRPIGSSLAMRASKPGGAGRSRSLTCRASGGARLGVQLEATREGGTIWIDGGLGGVSITRRRTLNAKRLKPPIDASSTSGSGSGSGSTATGGGPAWAPASSAWWRAEWPARWGSPGRRSRPLERRLVARQRGLDHRAQVRATDQTIDRARAAMREP